MVQFAKGHGTQNDFIIIPDPQAEISLDDATVAALCDRQRGLGADGLLHVSKAGVLLEKGVLERLPADVAEDDWFMDYRNADGSIAEMCGNGVRVFAHYVSAFADASAVVENTLRVGTRAGLRPVVIHSVTKTQAMVSVDMGSPEVIGVASAYVGENKFAGIGVDVGNPHLACVIPELDSAKLQALDLRSQVETATELFPNGVNLEVVTPLDADNSVAMRVVERGVGETRSCGTGTVAAAISALADAGRLQGTVEVMIPGGHVQVAVAMAENENLTATLTGPSVIHTHGDISLDAVRLA